MKKSILKILFFYKMMSLSLFLIVVIFIISLSPNIITLNNTIPFKNDLNALARQGWAFFTKDVHKDFYNVYEIRNNKVYLLELKSADLNQYIGFKRENRIIQHKMNTIFKNIEPNFWYNYKGSINKIKLNELTQVSIHSKKPMVYGLFLIEQGTPLPYDWYKSKIKVNRNMKYVKLEIKK
jgi:Sporulation delaying protein SdpA